MDNLAMIHPRRNIITVLVMLSLCLSNLWSGTTGKIMGTVTDRATGEPLAGANVIIEESIMGSSTDQEGFYYIINVPPGTYSVTVSYIGYGRLTQSNVRVMADRSTSLIPCCLSTSRLRWS